VLAELLHHRPSVPRAERFKWLRSLLGTRRIASTCGCVQSSIQIFFSDGKFHPALWAGGDGLGEMSYP